MRSKWIRTACLALGLSAVAAAQNPARPPRQFELKAESPKFWNLIANTAKLEKVAGGFGFTEGPVWDPRGFLYVSDEEKNKLSRLIRTGESKPCSRSATRTAARSIRRAAW